MEWIKLTLSSGTTFSCPVNGWLDSGPDAAGPHNRTVDCHDTGKKVSEMPSTSPGASCGDRVSFSTTNCTP